MALIFRFDKEGNLADEAAYQVDVFRELISKFGEQAFRYVALVADYEGPYWQKPLAEKKRLAAEQCFGKHAIPPDTKEKADELWKDAFKTYTDCQYDHIEEQLQACTNKHYDYTEIMNDTSVKDEKNEIDEKSVKSMQIIQKMLGELEKEIDRLRKKVVERRNEDSRSRGDKKDSWLSGYLANKLTDNKQAKMN